MQGWAPAGQSRIRIECNPYRRLTERTYLQFYLNERAVADEDVTFAPNSIDIRVDLRAQAPLAWPGSAVDFVSPRTLGGSAYRSSGSNCYPLPVPIARSAPRKRSARELLVFDPVRDFRGDAETRVSCRPRRRRSCLRTIRRGCRPRTPACGWRGGRGRSGRG